MPAVLELNLGKTADRLASLDCPFANTATLLSDASAVQLGAQAEGKTLPEENTTSLFHQAEFVLQHKPLSLIPVFGLSDVQFQQFLSQHSPCSQNLQNLFGPEFSACVCMHVFLEKNTQPQHGSKLLSSPPFLPPSH